MLHTLELKNWKPAHLLICLLTATEEESTRSRQNQYDFYFIWGAFDISSLKTTGLKEASHSLWAGSSFPKKKKEAGSRLGR